MRTRTILLQYDRVLLWRACKF